MGPALRRLLASPGFTLAALASIALASGLNILIFSFTSPVLVKAMPYPDVDRLLDVAMAPPGKPESKGVVTPALYLLLRDRASAGFAAVGAIDSGRSVNLAGDASGPAERLDGHRISATALAALGTSPLIGRLPTADDEKADAAPTIVLSYPVWQRHFGGRREVVDQTVQIDGQPTKIIAVMPEGFGLLDNSSDAFLPFSFEPAPGQEFQHNLRVVGRLKPGVSMADAHAAAKVALDEFAQKNPSRDKDWTVELTPWREARLGGMRGPFMYVQLGVGVILLLVCVSVAALLRARTVLGGRSLASTPASSGVVFGEGVLLAFGGAVIGAILAGALLPGLRELTPTVVPRLSEVRFNASAVGFTVVLVLVATLVIGLVPASRASQTSTTSKGWAGSIALEMLVAVQMVLAFVLIAALSLAIRAVGDLRSRDVGVNPAGMLAADVYLPREPYVTRNVSGTGAAEIASFSPDGPALYDRIRAGLQQIPGVVQVAGAGTHPFGSNPFAQLWTGDVEHTPDNQVAVQYLTVTENYFNTMGFRIVRGRDFTAADKADSPWVVLVNETLAKQQWPNADPIGQKLTMSFSPNDEEPVREVIGLVADTSPFRGASEVPPLVFVLQRQQGTEQRASLEPRRTVMTFIVKTSGDPLALADTVRAAVGKVDATTPVASIRTVEYYLNAGQTVLFQYLEKLVGLIALVVLVAAAVGVYAVTAYGRAHRQSAGVAGLFAVLATGIGVAVGWTGWMKLAGVLASFLTNLKIQPSDSGPLVLTGGVLLLTALVAFAAGRRPAAGGR